jgi:hypothetical protein
MSKLFPAMTLGLGNLKISKIVGATSANSPSGRKCKAEGLWPEGTMIKGTGLFV